MSQKTAQFSLEMNTPSLKLPEAILSNDHKATGDRRQATGDRRQATGDRRQATGDRRHYTHLITNRVNYPTAFFY